MEPSDVGIVQKTVDLLRAFINIDADPLKMSVSISSLENNHRLTMELDGKRESLSQFSEAIEVAMDWLANRETMKQRVAPAAEMSHQRASNDTTTENFNSGSIEENAHNSLEDETSTIYAKKVESIKKVEGNQTASGSLECAVCGRKLSSKSVLKSHMRGHQDDEKAKKPFECDGCDRRFASMKSLKVHKKNHLPDGDPRKKEFKCDICGQKLASNYRLQVHKIVHLDDSMRPFKCNDCGKGFVHGETLNVHRITHLPADDPRRKKVQCDICGKFLAGQQGLNYHKQTHLDDNDPQQAQLKRPFKCEECGVSFRSKKFLRKHVNTQHTTSDDPRKDIYKLECDICGKLMASQASLTYHKQTHIDDTNPEQAQIKRPFKCAECGEAFRKEVHLTMHARTKHSKDESEKRPFECDICGMWLTRITGLRSHQKTHLPDNEKRKEECNICLKKFGSKNTLERHKLTHLEENDPELIKRMLKCEYCGKLYRDAQSFKKHKKLHFDDVSTSQDESDSKSDDGGMSEED